MQATEILLAVLLAYFSDRKPDDALFAGLGEAGWEELFRLSADQGVLAIMYDIVSALPKDVQLPRSLRIRWALSAESIKDRYAAQETAAAELAAVFGAEGMPLTVFKGLSLARYYPVPECRECGDIDVFLSGGFAQANDMMRAAGIHVDGHGDKHSIFIYNGVPVENHSIFLSSKSRVDRLLAPYLDKAFASAEPVVGEVNFPPPDFTALFLLRHTAHHFGADSIAVRHLADWGLFLRNAGDRVDWPGFRHIATETGLDTISDIFTVLAMRVTGADLGRFLIGQPSSGMEERVLGDIMTGAVGVSELHGLFARLKEKTSRKFANKWKYDLLLPDRFYRDVVFPAIRSTFKDLGRKD